eukprot:451725-Prorocentrum_lima.AAC.1
MQPALHETNRPRSKHARDDTYLLIACLRNFASHSSTTTSDGLILCANIAKRRRKPLCALFPFPSYKVPPMHAGVRVLANRIDNQQRYHQQPQTL